MNFPSGLPSLRAAAMFIRGWEEQRDPLFSVEQNKF